MENTHFANTSTIPPILPTIESISNADSRKQREEKKSQRLIISKYPLDDLRRFGNSIYNKIILVVASSEINDEMITSRLLSSIPVSLP